MDTGMEVKRWNQISGFFEEEDIEALQELARDKVCLEIGAFYGRSTVAMAEVAKEVVTVDTFKASGNGAEQEDHITVLKDFESNTKGYSNIHVFVGLSEVVVPDLVDGMFDLVLIDASHKYKDVKVDIEVSWPKLKDNGVMAFHDYGKPKGWPGVTQAVDERFTHRQINGPYHCLAWVQK